MEFDKILLDLVSLFSGGISGAISNLVLLAALVITAYKIRNFLRGKTLESSKTQARVDRSETISENQSKDSMSMMDEKSLDTWRKGMRNGSNKIERSDDK